MVKVMYAKGVYVRPRAAGRGLGAYVSTEGLPPVQPPKGLEYRFARPSDTGVSSEDLPEVPVDTRKPPQKLDLSYDAPRFAEYGIGMSNKDRLLSLKPPTNRPNRIPVEATSSSTKVPVRQFEDLSKAELARLSEIESGGHGYTAFNEGSKAYGKYQFIPSTAKEYASKLGLAGDSWKTPENQEKMFEAFTKDNIAFLQKKGLPVDLFHIYGVHQQGRKGFSEILQGKLNPARERTMRSNVPNKYKHYKGESLRRAWMDHWKEKTEV